MTRAFQDMDPAERLALARGEPAPTIELTRQIAEDIVKALAYAGQHHLAFKVKEALQWAQ